jgi:urease accessory protein
LIRRISVRAALGHSGTVLEELAGTEPWRPRPLAAVGQPTTAGPRAARVALVQSSASLLSGDDVAVSISVGEGAALELVELGATLAHHARGGSAARVSVEVRVDLGGRLVWLGEPLILAYGTRVSRTTAVHLGRSARLLLGEATVLGRAREAPGSLTARTRIECDGSPVVDETLETGDVETLRSAVVAGQARMLGTVTLAGTRDGDPPHGAMQAHGPATLWRACGAPVDVVRAAAAVTDRWRAVMAAEQSPLAPAPVAA